MQTGAQQFADWMERRWPNSDRKARECAAHFQWDETFISKLVQGKRLPGLTNAVRIERFTGIPVEAWLSSEVDEPEIMHVTSGRKRK